jgi:hypothetical protein
MTPVLPDARAAFATGLCILPAREDGSKAPDVSGWKQFQQTRPTVEQMRGFGFDHRAGLGIVAGPASGYRECWDFDTADVFDRFIEAAHACGLGDLVDRIRASYEDATPGGGRRWIVAYPESVSWQDCTLARRPGRDGEPKVKTLIELPTFAILAPSNGGTHPSGKPYRRVSGDFASIARYTADEREALFELARSFDQMPRREHAAPKTKTQSTSSADSKPGEDYNQRTTWPELLEPAGWTHVYDHGDVSYWRRPGKDIGVSASTNHGGGDCLYVFTSSTALDPDTSYTRFGFYAALHHKGDFSKAALALSKHGYGEQGRDASTHERRTRPGPAPAEGASWRWLSEVKREQVDWLWQSRLAYGTLALWIGDGGLGKSRASNDLAARVTTGRAWPDGGPPREPASVAILSAEDSPSYTIRPAIEAAGGDVRRIALLDAVRDEHGTERTFNLSTDLAALERMLDATQACLVVIDPLSAYFGTRLDSYRDTDVRSVLEPVSKLAERRHLVVLGIMHVGKGTERHARHRALGSVAFVNAARLVFAIGADPDDASRRLLVPVKANLCREAAALAFRLEDADGVARVVWDTAPVPDVSADLVLNGRPIIDPDQQDAQTVIRMLFEDELWPLDAKIALEAGKAHGIPERTMRAAARRLGIGIRKLGFRSGWQWHAPEAATTNDARTVDEAANVAPSEADRACEAATVAPSRDDAEAAEAASVCAIAPSGDLAPSAVSQGAIAASAPSQKHQQNTRRNEGASGMSTRPREDLPAWVVDDEPATPLDASEAAFAGHDEETEPVRREPRPGRCRVCNRPLTNPGTGPCPRCCRRGADPKRRSPQ